MDTFIKSYKGFDEDLSCQGFQYEVGKEYSLPPGEKPSVCANGFHACESPLEVFDYYFMDDNANLSRFCEVEQSGELSKEENFTKVASSKIKIKAEIPFADLINLGVEWLKEKASPEKIDAKLESHLNNKVGDCAQISSSGDDAKIGSSSYDAHIASSGYHAQIGSSGCHAQIGSSGYYAQIGSSGDCAKIGSSGRHAQIGSSGYYAKIGSSGDHAKIASSGFEVQIGSCGDQAKIASSGCHAQIASSGYNAQIGSSGCHAQIGSSGFEAQIASSGDYAQIASSGDYAKINSTGNDSVIMCTGSNSRAKAKKGSWITLAEWYRDEESRLKPKCVKTEYVDGERIKADTWYGLYDGEFKEI